jgi:hypothetical protein
MQTDLLKNRTHTIGNTLLYAVKNGQLKRWFYEFQHGHPFLLKEEADIIIETRLNDKASQWMNDEQIKELVKLRVKAMYKKKFPNAKRWSLPIFNCT